MNMEQTPTKNGLRTQEADQLSVLLWTIRAFFLLVWGGTAAYLAMEFQLDTLLELTATFVGILLLGLIAIGADILFKRKKIGIISAIFFGVLVGMLASSMLLTALLPFIRSLLPPTLSVQDSKAIEAFAYGVIPTIVCYLCISFLLQTKDDFRFIIPYVEFAKELKGSRPFVLDTSVIIDGRIADLAEMPLFDNPLVVPGFVLQELQMVADSSDKLKRNRGRRGLDVLNRLRSTKNADFHTNDTDLPEFRSARNVDQQLVLLARHLNGKVVTNDFNLNKLARAQGVEVVNLNDIAKAMKPVVLPGEHMSVRITKAGEQQGQGVGYLDDGTMVVAEQGRSYIGSEVNLLVTSVLQTSAGRMIFGKVDGQS